MHTHTHTQVFMACTNATLKWKVPECTHTHSSRNSPHSNTLATRHSFMPVSGSKKAHAVAESPAVCPLCHASCSCTLLQHISTCVAWKHFIRYANVSTLFAIFRHISTLVAIMNSARCLALPPSLSLSPSRTQLLHNGCCCVPLWHIMN